MCPYIIIKMKNLNFTIIAGYVNDRYLIGTSKN